MRITAQRFPLSTPRPFKYRDADLPEAYVVSLGDDGVICLAADLDLPVTTFPSLTPDEAEQIGQALIDAAKKARAALPVPCDCGCGKTRDVVRREIMQAASAPPEVAGA